MAVIGSWHEGRRQRGMLEVPADCRRELPENAVVKGVQTLQPMRSTIAIAAVFKIDPVGTRRACPCDLCPALVRSV